MYVMSNWFYICNIIHGRGAERFFTDPFFFPGSFLSSGLWLAETRPNDWWRFKGAFMCVDSTLLCISGDNGFPPSSNAVLLSLSAWACRTCLHRGLRPTSHRYTLILTHRLVVAKQIHSKALLNQINLFDSYCTKGFFWLPTKL